MTLGLGLSPYGRADLRIGVATHVGCKLPENLTNSGLKKKKRFLTQNNKVLEILLFRCHKGHRYLQVSDHMTALFFNHLPNMWKVLHSAAESPVSRLHWIQGKKRKKETATDLQLISLEALQPG